MKKLKMNPVYEPYLERVFEHVEKRTEKQYVELSQKRNLGDHEKLMLKGLEQSRNKMKAHKEKRERRKAEKQNAQKGERDKHGKK